MKKDRAYRVLYYPVMSEFFNINPELRIPSFNVSRMIQGKVSFARFYVFMAHLIFFLGIPGCLRLWLWNSPIGEQNVFVYSNHDFLAQPFGRCIWSNGQCYFWGNHHRKVIVNRWSGAWWFGFLGSFYEREFYLGVPIRFPNYQSKPPIYHWWSGR